MAGRLEGKVSVITGTGGSIGRATALTFAREGASVVGCDVAVEPAQKTVEMARAEGGAMVSLQPCRLSDPGDSRCSWPRTTALMSPASTSSSTAE